MNSLDKKSIFDANSQLLDGVDLSKFRPLEDNVVIRDEHESDEKVGSVFISISDHSKDKIRIGVIVAVGLGDRFKERMDAKGEVRRKALKCISCGGAGVPFCRKCEGSGLRRDACQCKVGDRVIFVRRREGEFEVDGRLYQISHAEQSVLCII